MYFVLAEEKLHVLSIIHSFLAAETNEQVQAPQTAFWVKVPVTPPYLLSVRRLPISDHEIKLENRKSVLAPNPFSPTCHVQSYELALREAGLPFAKMAAAASLGAVDSALSAYGPLISCPKGSCSSGEGREAEDRQQG